MIDEEIRTLDPPRGRRISVNRKGIARQFKRLDCDDGLRMLYEDASVYPLRQFRKPDDPKTAQEAQEPVNAANDSQPAPRGLVYALFDAKAIARLERAGAEIARLRQQLRSEHDTTTSAVRVQRCREIARQECAQMVVVVEQLRRRFRLQGSGSVFIPGLHPLVVEDHLHEAQNELMRMSSPAVWRQQ